MFNRPAKSILSSLGQARHWKALANIFRSAKNPFDFLTRYLFGRGEYPATILIKHAPNPIAITAYTWHDVLTINEIFFRKDYDFPPDSRVVVDFGSNIGVSALYFVTHSQCHVYAYEPVPENIRKFKSTMEAYEARCTLKSAAVSTAEGSATFGVEDTGRYGGINVGASRNITVKTVCANDELASIVERHGIIDVLKIDIENMEMELLHSLDDSILKKIRFIFLELNGELLLSKAFLAITARGTIYALKNTLL